MNKEQVKGVTNQATGEIKEHVGRALGDKSMEAEGHLREAKGKAQEKLGDAKETITDVKDTAKAKHERDIELNRANDDLDSMGRK